MPEISSGSEAATIRTDIENIRHLVRLMHRYDLTALDLVEGETQIRLRRGNRLASPAAPATLPPAYAPAPAPVAGVPAAASAPAPAAEPAAKASNDIVVESPMVGTFYASSSPDAPPFVSVGSTVRENTTSCIIEAMKVFTDIPAGVNGKVKEVLVKSGQSVEFGTPLFRIEPA